MARAVACQATGREFESRFPLLFLALYKDFMDIKAEYKELGDVSYVLQVDIPFGDFKNRYEEAKKEIASHVQIPGFRKGKVPLDIVEKKFKASIHEETFQKLIPEAYQKAVEMNKLKTFGTPFAKNIGELKENEPIHVVFEVDKAPEVQIKSYELNVEEHIFSFDLDPVYKDEEYRLLRSKAEFKDSDKGAEKGDYLRVNIEDRSKLEGHEGHNHSIDNCPLELREGANTPFELNDELLGLKMGDKKTVKKTLSKNYREEHLAGLTMDLEVEVLSVKKIVLPDLTEELAKDLQFDSIEVMKETLKENVDSYVERFKKTQNYMSVIDSIKKEASFVIPPSLVESAVEHHIGHMLSQFGGDRSFFENFLKEQGRDIEHFKMELRPKAIEDIKNELILDKILEEKKIEPEEEELKKEIEKIAKQNKKEYKEFRKEFIQSGQYSHLRDNLTREKSVLNLFDLAKKKKGKEFTNQDIL